MNVYIGPVLLVENAPKSLWIDDVLGHENLAQIRIEERSYCFNNGSVYENQLVSMVYLVPNDRVIGRSFDSSQCTHKELFPFVLTADMVENMIVNMEANYKQDIEALGSRGFTCRIEFMCVPYSG